MSNRNDLIECKKEFIIFQGYLKIYGIELSKKEPKLEKLKIGDELKYKQIISKQKYTKATGRYTEASLVKALEKKGIGRPSTFSNLISTIQDRKYVVKETRKGNEQKILIFTLNTPKGNIIKKKML